jgi:hypothetical protein
MRTLGVRLAPDGNDNDKFKYRILVEVATMMRDHLKTAPLKPRAGWYWIPCYMANTVETPPRSDVLHQKAMCKDPSPLATFLHSSPKWVSIQQPWLPQYNTWTNFPRRYECNPPRNRTGGGTHKTYGIPPSERGLTRSDAPNVNRTTANTTRWDVVGSPQPAWKEGMNAC